MTYKVVKASMPTRSAGRGNVSEAVSRARQLLPGECLIIPAERYERDKQCIYQEHIRNPGRKYTIHKLPSGDHGVWLVPPEE